MSDSFEKLFVKGVGPETESPRLKSRMSVVKYLQAQGYETKRQRVYDACEKGILKLGDDGTLCQKDVDLYALTHLRKNEVDQKQVAQMQFQKTQLEMEVMSKKLERETFNLGKEQGKYLPRDDFERELAGRAAVFDVGLKHEIRIFVAELIAIVGGDVNKKNAFLDRMSEVIDAQLNVFVQTDTYQVVFLGDEE